MAEINVAPTLATNQTGQSDLNILAKTASAASRSDLKVFNGGLNKETVAAGKAAGTKQLEMAKILEDSIASQSRATGESIASIKAQADAKIAATQAVQAKEDESAAINQQVYAATGSNVNDPSSLVAQIAAQTKSVAEQRMAVADKVTANQAIEFTDKPLDWLMAQFETSGLIEQHNALAAKQNGLVETSQQLLQMSHNMAEAQKVLVLGAQGAAEKNAAIVDIRETANQAALKSEMELATKVNGAAGGVATLFENHAQSVYKLDATQIDYNRAHIASWNDNARWKAGGISREVEIQASKNNAAAGLVFKNLEQQLGWQENTGAAIIKTLPTKEEQDMAVRFGITGRVDSPEQAAVLAKLSPDAAPQIKEMLGMSLQAEQNYNNAKAKNAVSVTDNKGAKHTVDMTTYTKEQEAATKMKFMRENIQAAVMKKAQELPPVAVPDAERKYPELALMIADSTLPHDSETVLNAFLAGNNGDIHTAAVKYAAYSKEKLKVVTVSTLTDKVGVESPTQLIAEATYKSYYGLESKYKLIETDPSSVEHFIRIRDGAKARPQVGSMVAPTAKTR